MTDPSTPPSVAEDRRWYDSTPELKQSVGLLESFPDEIRMVVATGLVELAERKFQADKLMSSRKSLGPDKVLGIYKSKNKRRALDREPACHQTLNYFYALSDENRLRLAKLARELATYIYRYTRACRDWEQAFLVEDVAHLARHFVDMGDEEAQRFLHALEKQFRSHGQQPKGPAAPRSSDYIVSTDESGTHVKKHQ
jgi:hypothetical protein